MEIHARHTSVAIHQAGGQTVGAIGIARVERRRNLEAGRLIVDVLA